MPMGDGELFFAFSTKIGLKLAKKVVFCMPIGGGTALPGYATDHWLV